MNNNDATDRIVVNISWSLDTKVFRDLSKEIHDKTGEPGRLSGNTYHFPENFASGYCKHWRVEEHMAAFYIRYTANRPLLLRRNILNVPDLTLIGFIGNNNATSFTTQGRNIDKHTSFIITSQTLIENEVNTGETVMALMVTVTPAYLHSLAHDANRDLVFQLSPEQFELMQQMEQNLHDNSADFFYLKGTLNQLFARSFPFATNTPALPQKPEVKKLTQLVNELLQDFTRPSPHITEAAAMVGVSPSKFKALFVKLYKQSYYSYLQQNRLEKAKVLLLQGNRSVADIAYSLGYSSGSHFTRLFRKKFHVAPQTYKSFIQNQKPTDSQL